MEVLKDPTTESHRKDRRRTIWQSWMLAVLALVLVLDAGSVDAFSAPTPMLWSPFSASEIREQTTRLATGPHRSSSRLAAASTTSESSADATKRFDVDTALFCAGLAFDAYVEPDPDSSRWERGVSVPESCCFVVQHGA